MNGYPAAGLIPDWSTGRKPAAVGYPYGIPVTWPCDTFLCMRERGGGGGGEREREREGGGDRERERESQRFSLTV